MAKHRGRPAGELRLDPGDPTDRQIIGRQVAAARQSGRERRDRAGSTRGRADLEQAYDEGAAEPDEEEPAAAGPGRAARAGAAVGKGAQASADYLSKGRWRPTLTPPTRARDAGSLLTGLLLYTVAITYIRYGAAGWRGWLSAKFLNKPLQGLAPEGTGGPIQRRTA
ncbi:hypothetical protein AB0K51_12410 [Kitasatospora sp. NPDC049285]|uniref:hypothetical protein n=1 Tax=Kitasatospora sp. NPDC049285 TaxID=3157096 RepID=UPI003418E79A